jgi:predicted nucleic acid-binding protein
MILISEKIKNNMVKEYNKIYNFLNISELHNIEYTEDDNNKLISTEIWNKFKKENKEYVLEKKISIEIFKEIIIKNISISKYTEKTKKGAIEFIGIKFKNIVIETNNLIIETENLIDEPKKKKVKKEKQKSQYYFNEETDNKILECAIESNSEYIISYYKHLLNLKEYQSIKILTPEEFLSIF